MKRPLFRNSVLAALALLALAGCTAKCNCPVCPAAQQQPQTTIIHEPD